MSLYDPEDGRACVREGCPFDTVRGGSYCAQHLRELTKGCPPDCNGCASESTMTLENLGPALEDD